MEDEVGVGGRNEEEFFGFLQIDLMEIFGLGFQIPLRYNSAIAAI
jgi:hypothetical protein